MHPSSISPYSVPGPHATFQLGPPGPAEQASHRVFRPLRASLESSPRDLPLHLDQPCALTPPPEQSTHPGLPSTPGAPREHESVASCSQRVARMVATDNELGRVPGTYSYAVSRQTGEERVSNRSVSDQRC